jgi:hypothetical protein
MRVCTLDLSVPKVYLTILKVMQKLDIGLLSFGNRSCNGSSFHFEVSIATVTELS